MILSKLALKHTLKEVALAMSAVKYVKDELYRSAAERLLVELLNRRDANDRPSMFEFQLLELDQLKKMSDVDIPLAD